MKLALPASDRSRWVAVVAVVGVVAAGLVVAVSRGGGERSSKLVLSPGTVWLATPSEGRVSLFDGATASRVTSVLVAQPRDDVEVVQASAQVGSGAYAVNRTAGTVSAVDGATLAPGPPKSVTFANDRHLAVVSNPKATWAVAQGGTLARDLDPRNLDPVPGSGDQALANVSSAVLVPDGSLWTISPGGVVRGLAAGGGSVQTSPVGADDVTLVAAAGRPVLADTSTSTALVLGPDGSPTQRLPLEVPAGARPLVSGTGAAPLVLSVGPTNGTLAVTDLARRRSRSVPVGDASSTARYGEAVAKGDLVFVPDFAQGAVVVVAIGTDGNLEVRGQVSIGLTGGFVLVSHDHHVWFDDPKGTGAGVITDDLQAVGFAKVGGDGAGHVVGHLEPLHHGPPKRDPPPTDTKPTTRVTPPTLTPPPSHGTPSSQTLPTTPTTPTTPKPPPPPPPPQPPGPGQADFSYTPDPAVAGQPVTFTDRTKGPHSIFKWTFDQGTPAESANATPSVTWATPGTYTAVLVVTRNGQSTSKPIQVPVKAPNPPSTNTTSSTSTTTTTAPQPKWNVINTSSDTTIFTTMSGSGVARFSFQPGWTSSQPADKDDIWAFNDGPGRCGMNSENGIAPVTESYDSVAPESLPGQDYAAFNGFAEPGQVLAARMITGDYAVFQVISCQPDGGELALRFRFVAYHYG